MTDVVTGTAATSAFNGESQTGLAAGGTTAAAGDSQQQPTQQKANDHKVESKAAPADDDSRLEKLIQSKVDRLMAEERKKSAALQKELSKLQKAKLSDEELQKLELEERQKTLAEKEKALAEKEGRLYAIKAIKAAGLDDGSDNALALVDFVMGSDETATDERVKAFKKLLDAMVAVQVGNAFKNNGRTPAGTNPPAAEATTDSNPAVRLGKARAEQKKKSKEIVSYYLGGRK